MANKSQLGDSVRCTRNQAPKYIYKRKRTTEKAKSSRNPRTINRDRTYPKSGWNVKLTEEQRTSILKVLNEDLHFCKKDANVGRSSSIIKLAEKMNVPSIVMCDWLGITDELNEILNISYLPVDQINSTLEAFIANMAFSGSTPEDDGSNLAEESEDKMDADTASNSENLEGEMDAVPCPEEMSKSMEISSNLNKVSACSDQEKRSEENFKLTGKQKAAVMKMMKKDLVSKRRVLKVGSAKNIQELADKMEVSTMNMRKFLGITDDLNQVVAESNVKVQGLECQTEALEEVLSSQKEDSCPEKSLELEGGLKVIAENYEEHEEELTPNLAPLVLASDEEEFVLESSKSLDQNYEELLAELEVSDDEVYELAPESFQNGVWTEEMKEYLKVGPAFEDGNKLECEILKTVAGSGEPDEMEMKSFSQKDSPAVEPTSEPQVMIKRKIRIDDYFPALKSIKKD